MTRPPRPVLVIGSLNMDLVATCDRLPAPGETVAGTGFAALPGGKGANQAVAAARLGARVFMAGCVGADFGAGLRAGLAAAGVDTTHLAEVPGPTGTALIAVDAAGANQIVVVPGANAATGPALIDRALAAIPGPGICWCSTKFRPLRWRTRCVPAVLPAGSCCSIPPPRARFPPGFCPRST